MRVFARALAGPAVIVAACAAASGDSPARAQSLEIPGFDSSVCEGEIAVFPLGAIPDAGAYRVDVFDDAEEALKFRDVFLAALRKSGRRTDEQGQLIFSFESRSSFPGLIPRAGEGRIELHRNRVTGPGVDAGVSEFRETIRGERDRRVLRVGFGRHIDIRAELRDGATGRVVWLATVGCDPLTDNQEQVTEFLSAALVDSLSREMPWAASF